MNYRINDRNRNRILPRLALLASGVLVLILCSSITRSVFITLLTPVSYGYTSVWQTLRNASQYLSFKSTLLQKIESQDAELAILREMKDSNMLLENENSTLRNMLGDAPHTANKKLTALLVHTPGFSQDTFLLSAGRAEGVSIGDRVFAGEHTLLGTISEVTEHSSLLSLYSTPERKTSVFIGNPGTEATLVGRGGGNFYIQVPKEFEVGEEDIATFPGSPSTLFAVVGSSFSNDTDAFQTVFLKLPVPLQTIQFVFIEHAHE